MTKQLEMLRHYEKLIRASKKVEKNCKNKPLSCPLCMYYRPDFKYRKCQFSRCFYGKEANVFRDKPLKKDVFSGNEVVKMGE